jgi:gamma-glutamylputrescine oxidase
MTAYIDSYYARTANPAPARAPLEGDIEAEVCVVGGGLAGLSTALGLAERGRSVVLLEARRVAWGASGRNGGFVGPGFAADAEKIIKRVGLERARALRTLTDEAVALIGRRIATYRIDCNPVPGGVIRAWWTDDRDAAKKAGDWLVETFGVELEFWPRERLRETLVTQRYFDALFFPRRFHFHPLNYALGIADAIEAKGGRVFEDSTVTKLETDGVTKTVHTAAGRVRARAIVMACGGYIDGLQPRLAGAIRPVATWVMATEPLGERLQTAIRTEAAIIDSRFDFDYYRPLSDTRILWGGGITIRRSDPADLREIMLAKLLTVYPQLKGIKVETAWSGLMSYPRHSMPQIGELSPGLWYGMGFGGHGMGTTTLAGELIAAAIAEGDDRYRQFAPFGLDWTGGALGLVAVETIYRWYRFRDWLKDFRAR